MRIVSCRSLERGKICEYYSICYSLSFWIMHQRESKKWREIQMKTTWNGSLAIERCESLNLWELSGNALFDKFSWKFQSSDISIFWFISRNGSFSIDLSCLHYFVVTTCRMKLLILFKHRTWCHQSRILIISNFTWLFFLKKNKIKRNHKIDFCVFKIKNKSS